MEKGNEFVETLQNSVEDEVLRGNEIKGLEEELQQLKSLVIRTPEHEKRIKELELKLAKIRDEISNEEPKKEVKEQEEKNPQPQNEQVEKFNIEAANYDELLARREEVKLALEEALASPVRDNKKIEELQRELVELEKAISILENLGEKDEKEDIKTKQEEKAEVEEQLKDEQELSEAEKQAKQALEDELKQAYYDAMVNFYAIRRQNAEALRGRTDRLVSTDEEYLREIKAEDEMYRARDAYLKLGKGDPYTAEREALREQEKKLQKANMELLQKKTQEYRQLEIELARLQKARKEKEEDIEKAINAGATAEIIAELNRDLSELDYKIKNVKQDLAKVKDQLSYAMDVLERRNARRRELSLETREYNAQSHDEKANIRYASGKESKGRNDYVQANQLETSNIKKEVARNEARYDSVKKQLQELKKKEPDNFEKRLALLEQLEDASQQLKASKEVEKDIERGLEPDTDEAIKQAENNYKSKEERKAEFVKDTENLREAAESQEKAEGERTVEDPTGIKEEVEKQQKEAVTMAVAGAMVVGGPNDSMVKDATEAALIYTATAPEKESIPPLGAPCPIAELNDPNLYVQMDEKGSKEYVQTVEAIEQANKVEEKAIEDAEKS